MKYTVTKKIDSFLRIVIPKEIRLFYGLDINEKVELIPTDNGILIRKNDVKQKENNK